MKRYDLIGNVDSRRPTNRALSCAAIALVAALATGCATTYSLQEEKARLPALSAGVPVTRLPLSVGLYIPKEVRERNAYTVTKLGKLHMPVGEVIVPYFGWATEQLFSKVAYLTTFTPGPALPDGLAGVIELAEAGINAYTIKLHSPGQDPVPWTIHGSPSILENARDLTESVRDATAQYIVHFSAQPKMREWLARNGVAESGVVPSFGEIAGASASKLRIVAMRNESGARSCLERPLTGANQRIEFLSADQFKLSHYPWFERSVVPAEEDRFLEYTKLPTMQRRLQAAGVRYLLNFDGDTQNTSSNAWYNGGSCFAGCVGVYTGTRHSTFKAAIFDLWQGKKIFDADATKSGDYALIWLLLPIPLFPATESQACNELAGRIAAALEERQKGQPQ